MEAPGFKKVIRPNLTLAMSGQLQIDIQLEVGALNESITISTESPILDTSTVTVGKALTTARNHGPAGHDQRHRPDGATWRPAS